MKRANAPEEKAERRRSILRAAENCFLKNGHTLPSAAEVAKAAHVAKGTVYLYFQSKEEIYLALFQEKLTALLDSLRDPVEGPVNVFMAQRVYQFLNSEPGFLPLAAMLQSILEMNLSETTLYQFKYTLSEAIKASGIHLDEQFDKPSGFSEQALIFSYSSLIGLWQLLQWPSALSDKADAPEFQPLRRDFEKELSVLFARIWNPPV